MPAYKVAGRRREMPVAAISAETEKGAVLVSPPAVGAGLRDNLPADIFTPRMGQKYP
ncbi:MAG: hypothetical protein KME26_27550 [Oscillatoria princeps RMCB-10]|nr:hypothetical protein [Oscillatoria princeps RMCB-10]